MFTSEIAIVYLKPIKQPCLVDIPDPLFNICCRYLRGVFIGISSNMNKLPN